MGNTAKRSGSMTPSIWCFELAPDHYRELHLNRSRNLLGVCCWEWYQNEAGKLYFLFFCTLFVVFTFFTSVLSKNKTGHKQNVHISTNWSNMDLPKKWDKILKIQYFTIRHLQNLKTLSADVLSKYELHTPLPRCDWLMQHIKLCVGELTPGNTLLPHTFCDAHKIW